MVVLVLYEQKTNKLISENYRETDLIELKTYGEYGVGSHPEFLKIPSTKISDKTILEWFTVNDLSYWWFVAPGINMKFNDAAFFIDNLISYIEKHSIHLLKIKTGFDKLNLLKKICNEKNLTLEVSKKEYFSFQIKQTIKNLIKKFAYKKITNQKQKKRLRCYEENKKTDNIELGSVILTTHGSYRRELINDKSGQILRQEFYIQPFLDLLSEQNIPVMCLDFDYTLRGETKILRERLSTNENWMPLEILFPKQKSDEVTNTINTLNKSIKDLLKSKNDNDSYTYNGIPILDYLGNTFEEIFFEPNLPTYINLIKGAEDFFQKFKPKSLIQVYEQGPFAKALEIAAKKLKIRTIGIQHGLITETTHDYMSPEIQSNEMPLGNPIPDITCVFGEYFKKILTEKGNYPEEKVVTMGNPVFYNIDRKIQLLKKQKIREKFKLSQRKIILVPLSNFKLLISKDNYDYILLDILNKGLRNQDNPLVLVRGHPGNPIDEKYLETLFPGNKFQTSKGSLFEDLYISDVVVTSMSTVGIDATIFQKPVIFANVTREKSFLGDFQEFMISHDVALLCDKDDLIPKILDILQGEGWEKEASIKRKEFLHSFFNYNEKVDLLKIIFGN